MPDSENAPEGKLDKPYQLLLYLLKAGYHRRLEKQKELPNPANWRYWDLSNEGIVQDILTSHRTLIEQIYNTAGFRTEFAIIAKLWHEHTLEKQARVQNRAPDKLIHVGFLTYDELVAKSVIELNDKRMHVIGLLQKSLAKALSKRYGVAADQVARLVWEVVERHLLETYGTSFFDR